MGLLALARVGRFGYNDFMRMLSVFLCVLLAAPSVFAQKAPVKNFWRALTRQTESVSVSNLRYARGVSLPSAAAVSAASLSAAQTQRAVVERLLPPSVLQQTESRIRQSLVEVLGRATGELMGSGFVVKSSSGRLYAVASYHVVGSAGNTVSLRMYNSNGNVVRYEGTVVSANGSYGLNAPDASVIALPPMAALHARALKVAKETPRPGERLVAWGTPYTEEAFVRVDELKVKHTGGLKIAMERADVSHDFNGLCGSPLLNANGEVAGVYSGHDPDSGLVFGVDARRTLELLIGNYEKGLIPYYSFEAYGKTIMRLRAGETVGWARHLDGNGMLVRRVYLPLYHEAFDPKETERLFPDVRRGDVLEFDILVHRSVSRTERFEVP